MVVTTVKSEKRLNYSIKGSEYVSVDSLIEEFKLCPLEIYVRGEYPEQIKVEKIAEALEVEDGIVMSLEAINWFQLTGEKIEELGIEAEPGKYLLNGNTRYLGLKELKGRNAPYKYLDVLMQEVDVYHCTREDFFDLQEIFNDETEEHTPLQKSKAIADLYQHLLDQGIKSTEASKICLERRGIYDTNLSTAKMFFVNKKMPQEDIDYILGKIESGKISQETGLEIARIIKKTKEPASALYAEMLAEYDTWGTGELSRQQVRDFKKSFGITEITETEDRTGEETDEDTDEETGEETAEEGSETKEKGTKREFTDEELDEASEAIKLGIKSLSDEVGLNEVSDDKMLRYRDCLDILFRIAKDLAPMAKLDDTKKLFDAQAAIATHILNDPATNLDDAQKVAISKRLLKVYDILG